MPALILAPALVASVAGAQNWFADPAFTKAQWRELAAYVRSQIGPNERVVLVSGHAAPAWDYYAADLSPCAPARYRHPGRQRRARLRLRPELAQGLAGKDGAWLVEWQNEVVDPVGFAPYFLDRAGQEVAARPLLLARGPAPLAPAPRRDLSDRAAAAACPGRELRPQARAARLGRPARGAVDGLLACPEHPARRLPGLADPGGRGRQRSSAAGMGGPPGYDYPTTRWPVGAALFGRYPLPLPAGADGPFYVSLGIYAPNAPEGLDIRDVADNPCRQASPARAHHKVQQALSTQVTIRCRIWRTIAAIPFCCRRGHLLDWKGYLQWRSSHAGSDPSMVSPGANPGRCNAAVERVRVPAAALRRQRAARADLAQRRRHRRCHAASSTRSAGPPTSRSTSSMRRAIATTSARTSDARRGDYKVYWSGVTNDPEVRQVEGGPMLVESQVLPDGEYTWVIEAVEPVRPDGQGRGQDHAFRRRHRAARNPQLHRDAAGVHAEPGRPARSGRHLLLPDEGRRARRRLSQAAPAAGRASPCCATRLRKTRRSRCRRPGKTGYHGYDYDGGVDLGAEPPPDGEYAGLRRRRGQGRQPRRRVVDPDHQGGRQAARQHRRR